MCGPCVQNFVFVIDDQRRKVATITVKKLEVDLASKKSSQLQSGIIQASPGNGPTSFGSV